MPELSFDSASLAMAENSDGKAVYATDFQPDSCGFIRILVVDHGLDRERAGALVQRVIEVETYRTFALLGLPEAHRLAPTVSLIEKRLAEVMDEMRGANDIASNRQLLNELTQMAAEVEAGAAASGFRFGASRAYEEIVTQRLQTIGREEATRLPNLVILPCATNGSRYAYMHHSRCAAGQSLGQAFACCRPPANAS
ncbi:putative membrane-anchored protein [Bradyrhizobium sp. GM24.11]